MITNKQITIYHKDFDDINRIDKWIRYNYDNTWFFGGKGAGINKGYDNANNCDLRIWYKSNVGLNSQNFSIGDIIVTETLDIDIRTQQDLSNYEIFNITSINDNNFGNNPHIHIGGK